MTAISKAILLFLAPLLLGMAVHKFYVSVTQVEYYPPDQAIQITSRVFIDDMEKALVERYEVKPLLGTQEETDDANTYIERYLRAKFAVKINDSPAEFAYLGKKIDNDILVLFLEIPGIDLGELSSVEIQNELLMDVFEEQKNILHFRFGDRKKSFVLLRDSNKGMLNF